MSARSTVRQTTAAEPSISDRSCTAASSFWCSGAMAYRTVAASAAGCSGSLRGGTVMALRTWPSMKVSMAASKRPVTRTRWASPGTDSTSVSTVLQCPWSSSRSAPWTTRAVIVSSLRAEVRTASSAASAEATSISASPAQPGERARTERSVAATSRARESAIADAVRTSGTRTRAAGRPSSPSAVSRRSSTPSPQAPTTPLPGDACSTTLLPLRITAMASCWSPAGASHHVSAPATSSGASFRSSNVSILPSPLLSTCLRPAHPGRDNIAGLQDGCRPP